MLNNFSRPSFDWPPYYAYIFHYKILAEIDYFLRRFTKLPK